MKSVALPLVRTRPDEGGLLINRPFGRARRNSDLAADTLQATNGANSPAIVGDNNKIIINDIDARALKHLNDLLDEKDLTIAQKVAEAEEWARKYRDLNQQLAEALSQAAGRRDDADSHQDGSGPPA